MREDVETIFDEVRDYMELDADQEELFNIIKSRVLRRIGDLEE